MYERRERVLANTHMAAHDSFVLTTPNYMDAPQTYRKDFGAMKRRVVEPAVKEIREKDGLKVKWEPIKAGRKIQTLIFTFPREQQTALPLDTPPPKKITREYIEEHAKVGESYEQARRRLSARR